MIFCKNCNKQNESGRNFCIYCGVRLAEADIRVTSAVADSAAANPIPTGPKKKKSGLIAAIAISTIILAGAGVYWMTRIDTDDSTADMDVQVIEVEPVATPAPSVQPDRVAASPSPTPEVANIDPAPLVAESEEDIFYRYIEEILVPELGLASLESQVGVMHSQEDEWFSLTGILSAYISDLDGDGVKDLLVLHLKEGETGEGALAYSLYGRVYVLEDGAVV